MRNATIIIFTHSTHSTHTHSAFPLANIHPTISQQYVVYFPHNKYLLSSVSLHPSPYPTSPLISLPSSLLPSSSLLSPTPILSHFQVLLPVDYSAPPSPQIRPVHKPLGPTDVSPTGLVNNDNHHHHHHHHHGNTTRITQSQLPSQSPLLLASEYRGPTKR